MFCLLSSIVFAERSHLPSNTNEQVSIAQTWMQNGF